MVGKNLQYYYHIQDLKKQIEDCVVAGELEDLYLPYRPKRRTRATAAKEAGLRTHFLVGLGSSADDYVHAADLFDLIVIDLGEYKLFLNAHAVVSSAVEGIRIDSTEVSYSGKRHVEKSVDKLVHPVTAESDLRAYRHSFTELKVSN